MLSMKYEVLLFIQINVIVVEYYLVVNYEVRRKWLMHFV